MEQMQAAMNPMGGGMPAGTGLPMGGGMPAGMPPMM